MIAKMGINVGEPAIRVITAMTQNNAAAENARPDLGLRIVINATTTLKALPLKINLCDLRTLEGMTLKDTHDTEVTVSNNSDKHQFEISYPEDAVTAGFAAYLDKDDSRIFYHTVVGEEFGGKGLASILVTEALQSTKEAGLTVVPVCPFVKGFVEKNSFEGYRTPDLDDIELVKSHM